MENFLPNLIDKYPRMFPRGFYFECLVGWYDLLDSLCHRLQEQTDRHGAPQIEVIQIKEKFGTLRFYVGTANDSQSALIDQAESLSALTCDMCGTSATLRSDGWQRTRCDKH